MSSFVERGILPLMAKRLDDCVAGNAFPASPSGEVGGRFSEAQGEKSGKPPIEIAFCISDSYARHAGVVIASVLASNPDEPFVFHVLSGDLSEENRGRLSWFERNPRVRLAFHTVKRERFSGLPVLQEHLSEEMYYRFLIPELIPSPRVLYSDVDVLVTGPLRPLWEMNLEGNPLAAVKEYGEFNSDSEHWKAYKRAIGLGPGAACFCSGLLLMDCARLREEGAVRVLFAETARCADDLPPRLFAASDQVVINRVFQGRILPLPIAYGMTPMLRRRFPRERIIVHHYMDTYSKPWCTVAWNTSWPRYLRALLCTPWRRDAARFVLGHLVGMIWSTQTKGGYRRSFLFGLRVHKGPIEDEKR